MNGIIRTEFAGSMLGVPGRYFNVVAADDGRILNQRFITQSLEYVKHGRHYRISAEVRFDDNCNNGHESFAITGDIRRLEHGAWQEDSGGCLHEEIAKRFPALAPLIRWHLTSTDGPMHYLANVLFFAGDRDCHGLRKGEFRQMRDKAGLPIWEPEMPEQWRSVWDRTVHAAECPAPVTVHYRPYGRTGEGKARELDAARRAAVWPDATDADLTQEPDALKAALLARLPGLLAAFKADMLTAGLLWPERKAAAAP